MHDKSNGSIDEIYGLLSIALHDLTAPIRGVGNLADWVSEDLEPLYQQDTITLDNFPIDDRNEIQKKLHLMQARCARMQRILNGFRQYIQIRKMEHSLIAFDLRATPLEIPVHENGQQPTVNYSGDEVVINTNKTKFTMALQELINNAVVHHNTPDDMTISVDLALKNDFATVAVTDNGPGIKTEFHNKVFEPFQTIFSRDIKDTAGMGLAIAKELVKQNGGVINIDPSYTSGLRIIYTWKCV